MDGTLPLEEEAESELSHGPSGKEEVVCGTH